MSVCFETLKMKRVPSEDARRTFKGKRSLLTAAVHQNSALNEAVGSRSPPAVKGERVPRRALIGPPAPDSACVGFSHLC